MYFSELIFIIFFLLSAVDGTIFGFRFLKNVNVFCRLKSETSRSIFVRNQCPGFQNFGPYSSLFKRSNITRIAIFLTNSSHETFMSFSSLKNF
jgi:hypothetical protein